jgi:hypothetical protein
MSGTNLDAAAALLALVRRHGGTLSPRQLQRADGRHYRTARSATVALNVSVRSRDVSASVPDQCVGRHQPRLL